MINWGILGLGKMATKFAQSFINQKNICLKGIASNSNLKSFGKKFKIDKKFHYKSYSDLLKSSEIDAVYISTVNNFHYQLISEAIDNNKSVLCEKPFVTTLQEASLIKNKIENNKHLFIEAIAYRSHPITQEILSTIKMNEIGKIKKICTSFGFKVNKVKKKSRLFNKDLGGGSILDLGCYPISFAELFRNKSTKLNFLNVSGSYSVTGVDDHAEIVYVMNNNVVVEAKVSFKENLPNNCIIYGTKKIMKITSPWLPEQKSIIEIIDGENYYKKFVICKNYLYINQLNSTSEYFYKKNYLQSNNLINIEKSYEIFKILDYWLNNIK